MCISGNPAVYIPTLMLMLMLILMPTPVHTAIPMQMLILLLIPKHDNPRPLRVQLPQQGLASIQSQRAINNQTHAPTQHIHIPLPNPGGQVRNTNNGVQPLANLLVLPLSAVHAGRRVQRSLRKAHLGQRPGRPGADGRAVGDGDDQGRTAVQQVEDEGSAAGTPRRGPHVGAEGGDAGEEDDHSVGADVGLRVGVAHGEGVGGFGDELVCHLVVACEYETGVVERGRW